MWRNSTFRGKCLGHNVCLFQSAHSRGVRYCTSCDYQGHGRFQSAHLHEVRFVELRISDIILMFQSAHLREVRCSRRYAPPAKRGFNPRTCVRCDYTTKTPIQMIRRFNPRTCVRCDKDAVGLKEITDVSIRAPA